MKGRIEKSQGCCAKSMTSNLSFLTLTYRSLLSSSHLNDAFCRIRRFGATGESKGMGSWGDRGLANGSNRLDSVDLAGYHVGGQLDISHFTLHFDGTQCLGLQEVHFCLRLICKSLQRELACELASLKDTSLPYFRHQKLHLADVAAGYAFRDTRYNDLGVFSSCIGNSWQY